MDREASGDASKGIMVNAKLMQQIINAFIMVSWQLNQVKARNDK